LGHYSNSAELYDLLYEAQKDYPAEAALLSGMIRERLPEARTVLDVGCGTGAHAVALRDQGFEVDGVDLEPVMIDRARQRCPEGTFTVGDMSDLDLPGRYDVIVTLFSSIGYVKTESGLRATLQGMRRHLVDGGLVLIDPWFEPGDLTDGYVNARSETEPGRAVCRVSRTVILGSVSRLEFEYLVGTADGIERRSEIHDLGLFTQEQMENALEAAGFSAIKRIPKVLGTRGVYVATAAP
jgi:SAM-dependent methyltransferase